MTQPIHHDSGVRSPAPWIEVWQRRLAGVVRGTPALADLTGGGTRHIVVGNAHGTVQALSGGDGATLWHHDVEGPVYGPPAVGDLNRDGAANVVIGSDAGVLFALDGQTGVELWRHATGKPIRVKPILAPCPEGADVIAADFANRVFRLDGRSGEVQWRTTLPVCPLTPFARGIASSPLLMDVNGDGRAEVVLGTRAKRVFALDAGSGRIAWSRRLRYGTDSSPVAWRSGQAVRLLIGSGEGVDGRGDNSLYALDGRSGRVLWRRPGGGGIDGAPVLNINNDEPLAVFASLADASVRAVRVRDGSLLWRHRLGPTAGCRHDADNVCIPRGQRAYFTDRSRCGSYATPLLRDLDGDGRIEALLGANSGALLALDAATGRVRYSVEMAGPIRPSPVVADLDGDGRSELVVLAGDALHVLRLPVLCPPLLQYKADGSNSGGVAVVESRAVAPGTEPARRRPPGGGWSAWLGCLTVDVWEFALFQTEKRLLRPSGVRLRPFYY